MPNYPVKLSTGETVVVEADSPDQAATLARQGQGVPYEAWVSSQRTQYIKETAPGLVGTVAGALTGLAGPWGMVASPVTAGLASYFTSKLMGGTDPLHQATVTAATEIPGAAIGAFRYTPILNRIGTARLAERIEAASTTDMMDRVQKLVPWWRGYRGDARGLTKLVHLTGEPDLHAGYDVAMRHIAAGVRGHKIALSPEDIAGLRIPKTHIEWEPVPQGQAPTYGEVDFAEAIGSATSLPHVRGGFKRRITDTLNHHLDTWPGDLGDEWRLARRGYAEGRTFLDLMLRTQSVDAQEARFFQDRLVMGLRSPVNLSSKTGATSNVYNIIVQQNRAPGVMAMLNDMYDLAGPGFIRSNWRSHVYLGAIAKGQGLPLIEAGRIPVHYPYVENVPRPPLGWPSYVAGQVLPVGREAAELAGRALGPSPTQAPPQAPQVGPPAR